LRHGQPEFCPDPVEFPELQHIVIMGVLRLGRPHRLQDYHLKNAAEEEAGESNMQVRKEIEAFI
jgi:hypothetical protein